MKQSNAFLALLTLLFALSGCSYIGKGGKGVQGTGVRKTEKRDLGPFKSIETTGAYEIDVNCQKPASFEIEGDDNILPLIRTEVRDGVLRVSPEKSYNPRLSLILRISLPDLESLSTQGAGKVHIVDVKNEKLALHSTGAAMIDAAGQTKTVRIESTGAGKIDTSNLRAEKAEIQVTGAASVDVFASEQLDVSVSGAGRVAYSGDPKIVNKNVSGIGSVSKKD